MRAWGINWAATLVAALAIYAIGFIIYGLLIQPEQFMAMAQISQAEMDAIGTSRMPFGPVMPLMTAIFLAILFKMGRRWAMAGSMASGRCR